MSTFVIEARFDGKYEPLVFERLKSHISQPPYQPCGSLPFYSRKTSSSETTCDAGETERHDQTAHIETHFRSCGIDVEMWYWGAEYFRLSDRIDGEGALAEFSLGYRKGDRHFEEDFLWICQLFHSIGVRKFWVHLDYYLAHAMESVRVSRCYRLPAKIPEGYFSDPKVIEQARQYLSFEGPLHQRLGREIRRYLRYFKKSFEEFREEWDIHYPERSWLTFLGIKKAARRSQMTTAFYMECDDSHSDD